MKILTARVTKCSSPRIGVFLLLWATMLLLCGTAAHAQDHLLFFNNPEKIRMPGLRGSAILEPGKTYTIFFHYRNDTRAGGPLVIGFQGLEYSPLQMQVRKGIADAQKSPPNAGKQAMARFLSNGTQDVFGANGYARYALPLNQWQVASGILSVRTTQRTRIVLYYRHRDWTVPGAKTIAVESPRREVDVVLGPDARHQYYRIGIPEEGMSRGLDGTYGLLYAFRVNAPEGSRVRVSFSPRGGKSGLVGSINGVLRQSRIVGAKGWERFSETVVGPDGLVLTTAPFGGVFYPVELLFQLVP